MEVLRLSPVELPPRVGPQFEEPAVQRVGQGKEPTALSVPHFYEFALHEVAVVVPQFGIQHAAHAAGGSRVGFSGVGSKPNGIAQKVTPIVHVQEHFLLGDSLAEALQSVGQSFQWGHGGPHVSDGVKFRDILFHCALSDALFLGRSLDDVSVGPERGVVTCLVDAGEHVLLGACPGLLVGSHFLPFDVEDHRAGQEPFELDLHTQVRHFGIFVVVAEVDVEVEIHRDAQRAFQL